MKSFRHFSVLLFWVLPALVWAGSPDFDRFFENRTLRYDYYHIGDAETEWVVPDRMLKEGAWAGNPESLIDPWGLGLFHARVYDLASNRLIYSQSYNTLFGEYQTTDPALNGEKRTYHESVLMPLPKKPVRLVIERSDKNHVLHPIHVRVIDPADYHIAAEPVLSTVRTYAAVRNGDPHDKVDMVWIAEGYAESDYTKFKKDVDRYADIFFRVKPYKDRKKDFNITGLFIPSEQSGVDEPRKNLYRNTAVNSSFNALDLERYLLTEDNARMRNVAAAVPYDAIVILVNSDRYGGGGIYNFYAITTVDHRLSDHVFVHEIGHSFAGLADEYYSSSVAYNDFYPAGVEPVEPNITALMDPENIKWKEWVSQGVEIPTDWGKPLRESLREKSHAIVRDMNSRADSLKSAGASEDAIAQARKPDMEKLEKLREEMESVEKKYADLQGKTGAFEGAGYSSEGLYRPALDCLMHSNSGFEFCTVCEKAIDRMIGFYTH